MRVATWNVQHGRRPDGAVDIDALVRWCAALDIDVLGLQEVDVGMARSGRVDTVERLAAGTGMVAAFGMALELDGGQYGNALLARGGMSDVAVVALRHGPGDEPRSVVTAAVDGIRIAVTHLSARAPRPQLDQLVDLVASTPGPLTVLGDLNLPHATVVDVCRARGIDVVGPDDPTYPADAPAVRIDHIAVREIACGPSSVSARAPVSDHRALVADLAWPVRRVAPSPAGRAPRR